MRLCAISEGCACALCWSPWRGLGAKTRLSRLVLNFLPSAPALCGLPLSPCRVLGGSGTRESEVWQSCLRRQTGRYFSTLHYSSCLLLPSPPDPPVPKQPPAAGPRPPPPPQLGPGGAVCTPSRVLSGALTWRGLLLLAPDGARVSRRGSQQNVEVRYLEEGR